MKKIVVLLLTVIMLLTGTSCSKKEEPNPMQPEVLQMKKICELATIECYYHNVAKFKQEDAEKTLWMTKDKHFWIEYDGIVKFGIDASKVSMVVNDTEVNIMIPKAKILDCKVESETLNKDSYIVDKDSADITAEDEVKALAESKKQLEENASKDQALFDRAQQEAETLLQNYVKNIGDIVDKEYKVNFVYLDDEGNPIENTDISQNDVNTSDLTE